MFGCGKAHKKPFFEADISGMEKIEIRMGRYENTLFGINPENLASEIEPFVEEFSVFLGSEIYTPEGQQKLLAYITDSINIELFLDSRELWGNIDEFESDLSEAFTYYKYHFPEEEIPKIFTYISGLDYKYPVKYHQNVLVIGVDMYLGSNNHWYSRIGVPKYMTYFMQPSFAMVDVFKQMGERHLRNLATPPESFIDFMIHEGKLLYFLDCMLPNTPDSLKIGYTTGQLDWIVNNSDLVWSFFIENQVLFSSDRQTIIKFMGEAPFTAQFGPTSPPKTAAFIGWQIVREYMRKNRDISLSQLVASSNSQEILTLSGYRPRRK